MRERVSAMQWAESHVRRDELENNAIMNLTLVFCRKSPISPALGTLRQAFVDALTTPPLPEGFRPPIATGSRRERASSRNVETLLANLLDMKAKGKPTLSLSLRPDTYSHTKLSSGFINLVKLAAHKSRGLLILKEGFRDPANPKNSRTARIKPSRAFRELLDTVVASEDDIVSEPHDLINLRLGKTKEIVPRTRWNASDQQARTLTAVEMSLNWFNLVIGEYEITYTKAGDGETHFLYPVLYAVYTDDFEHGGRFYTGKGGHQNLSKPERATIRFNGHPTVELDFGGLHIRMLYHLAGSKWPLKLDPYAAVLEAMDLDADAIFQDFPDIRDDLKEMLLALINETTRTPKEAVNRASFRLFNHWVATKDPAKKEEERHECKARKFRWGMAGLRPKEVLAAFQKAHAPIRDQFSKGIGLELQNIDATIARWVMFELMVSDADECIPCLPIHDSFITFAEYESTLREAMEMVYREVLRQQTGRDAPFRIPVKRP